MECFWITMTLFLHAAFCTPYLGSNFFSGSQYDPCFQNKNSGCRLTGRICTNVMPNSKSRLPMPDNCYQLEKWCIISFTEAGHLSKSRKSQWKNKLDFIKVRFIYTFWSSFSFTSFIRELLLYSRVRNKGTPWINVASGTFVKNNKLSPLNKRSPLSNNR